MVDPVKFAAAACSAASAIAKVSFSSLATLRQRNVVEDANNRFQVSAEKSHVRLDTTDWALRFIGPPQAGSE